MVWREEVGSKDSDGYGEGVEATEYGKYSVEILGSLGDSALSLADAIYEKTKDYQF